MNRIIAGDYKGKGVLCPLFGKPGITLPMFRTLEISKDTVESYEVQTRTGFSRKTDIGSQSTLRTERGACWR